MSNFQLVNFTTGTKIYSTSGTIERDPNTLGYHFINTGSVIVYINNIPVYPSGVLDTMYPLCKDVSKYTIRFDTSVLPVPNPELTVIIFNQSL
jgi:hypothetical protein